MFKSLGADDDVLTIGLNRAVVLLAETSSERRRGPQMLRELGIHPEGGSVGLYRGRYGPYVGHDGLIASLPRGADPDKISLDEALPLLAAQREKGKARRANTAKTRSTKAAPKKATGNGSTRDHATTSAAKKTRAAKKKRFSPSANKHRARSGAEPG